MNGSSYKEFQTEIDLQLKCEEDLPLTMDRLGKECKDLRVPSIDSEMINQI